MKQSLNTTTKWTLSGGSKFWHRAKIPRPYRKPTGAGGSNFQRNDILEDGCHGRKDFPLDPHQQTLPDWIQ